MSRQRKVAPSFIARTACAIVSYMRARARHPAWYRMAGKFWMRMSRDRERGKRRRRREWKAEDPRGERANTASPGVSFSLPCGSNKPLGSVPYFTCQSPRAVSPRHYSSPFCFLGYKSRERCAYTPSVSARCPLSASGDKFFRGLIPLLECIARRMFFFCNLKRNTPID